MAEFKDVDINKFMWLYYDPCLLLKIIDFYLKEKVYDRQELLEQRVRVLSCTRMDSKLRAAFKELHGNDNYPSGKRFCY